MSLSTLITFALLVKKVTRKNQSTKPFRPKTQLTRQDSNTSITSCSSNDESVSISSPKELKEHAALRDSQQKPIEAICTERHRVSLVCNSEKKSLENEIKDEEEEKDINVPPNTPSSLEAAGPNFNVIIRDFAYPATSSLHHGKLFESNKRSSHRLSEISLSSSEFTGRQARVLYDFYPETEYEIAMKAGQLVWVQYRQCHGWLIADVNEDTGLIPESYVEFTSENA
ncbi:hypothetical protein J3Q64DRAFT_1701417 [Phycomyces blakesleeanus]|uniref:SH3 domain-containing protein n=1 Tax=Phycomyces blakesleeanus TaxID=4837 RepID=A0ABR3ASC6_PHYBL